MTITTIKTISIMTTTAMTINANKYDNDDNNKESSDSIDYCNDENTNHNTDSHDDNIDDNNNKNRP